jgi:hypothetical protein
MTRPQQRYNDCVVAVFRMITGESEEDALGHFFPHAEGQPGFSVDVLSLCLEKVGWKLMRREDYIARVVTEPDGSFKEADKTFWRQFQGQGVIFFTAADPQNGHSILVRSGGIVSDPDASEDEFITDYFEHIAREVGGEISIASVSIVTKTDSGGAAKPSTVIEQPDTPSHS